MSISFHLTARGFAVSVQNNIAWLASYPRSGNTWLRFLLGNYAFSDFDGWSTCSFSVLDIHQWLGKPSNGYHKQELISSLDESFSKLPKSNFRFNGHFCKTHFAASDLHPLMENTSKVIHLIRHPKDVLLSSLNFHKLMKSKGLPNEYEATVRFIQLGGDPLWKRLGYGTWIEHFESWNKTDHPYLLLRYEDLKRDTLSEFIRVIEFLDIPLDRSRAEQAVERSTYQEIRRFEVKERAANRFFDVSDGRYFTHRGVSGQSLEGVGQGLDATFEDKFDDFLQRTGYLAADQAIRRSA